MPTTVTFFMVLLMLTIGYYTFGEPLLFDRLFFATLLLCGGYCFFTDKNMFWTVVILLAARLLQEIGWLADLGAWYLAYLVYLAGLYVAYRLWYDLAARLFIGLISLVMLSHSYWLWTGYDIPLLAWFIFKFAVILGVRHYIIMRPHIMGRYGRDNAGLWTHIDNTLYDLTSLSLAVETLMIGEFLLRHLLGFYDIQFIYHHYSEFNQVISLLLLGLILHENWHLFYEKHLTV